MAKRWRMWLLALAAAVPVLVALPQGRLACAQPVAQETSPNGHWTLTLCSRQRLFAMPGSGSDAPGWIVLRDREGAIRGVSALVMIQLWGGAGMPTHWEADQVSRPLVFRFALDEARNPVHRWLEDRLWRIRAPLRLTPSDADDS
jgi:hypothetical protein